MKVYRVIANQWWAGEVKPGGTCIGVVLAKSQKEARKKHLEYTGWLHDERTVKLTCVALAWR